MSKQRSLTICAAFKIIHLFAYNVVVGIVGFITILDNVLFVYQNCYNLESYQETFTNLNTQSFNTFSILDQLNFTSFLRPYNRSYTHTIYGFK